MSIPDEGDFKGESCALNFMFIFVLIHLIMQLLFDVNIKPIFYTGECQLKQTLFTIHPFLDKYHQYSWIINSTSIRHILSKKYPYYKCVCVLATQITQNLFHFRCIAASNRCSTTIKYVLLTTALPTINVLYIFVIRSTNKVQ